jgi:aromatic-L-amino-acid decarboxylase
MNFEQRGIDRIVGYQTHIDQMPVRVQVKLGNVKSGLPASPPTTSESLDNLMQDLQNIIVPGLTQVQHPMHFGWFPSNSSLTSVLGDITSSGLSTH